MLPPYCDEELCIYNPQTKGLRDRNSPICTLSQNGYGAVKAETQSSTHSFIASCLLLNVVVTMTGLRSQGSLVLFQNGWECVAFVQFRVGCCTFQKASSASPRCQFCRSAVRTHLIFMCLVNGCSDCMHSFVRPVVAFVVA